MKQLFNRFPNFEREKLFGFEWRYFLKQEIDSGLFQKICPRDVLIAFGLRSGPEMEYAGKLFESRRGCDVATLRRRQCQFTVDCDGYIPAIVGPFDEQSPSVQASLAPWTEVTLWSQ